MMNCPAGRMCVVTDMSIFKSMKQKIVCAVSSSPETVSVTKPPDEQPYTDNLNSPAAEAKQVEENINELLQYHASARIQGITTVRSTALVTSQGEPRIKTCGQTGERTLWLDLLKRTCSWYVHSLRLNGVYPRIYSTAGQTSLAEWWAHTLYRQTRTDKRA